MKLAEKVLKQYEAKKKKNCWKGYERVPGTKAGDKGSCRKK